MAHRPRASSASDSLAVYLGVSAGANVVRRTYHDSGAPPVDLLATHGVDLRDCAIDSARIYVVDATNNTVLAVDHALTQTITYSSTEAKPSALALDATYVYWTNLGDGTVKRTLKAGGGAVETIASGQVNPTRIAVNSRAVFWTTNAGRMFALRKP